jgi:hypothetical protein
MPSGKHRWQPYRPVGCGRQRRELLPSHAARAAGGMATVGARSIP